MSDRELLSLLPVFDAIMSERSISRAAARLGVTQSAVSQALGRLRKITNDPLFEGHGRGVRATPRAQDMAGHVRSALTHVSAAFAPKDLDIAALERTFTLDIGGGFDALILPLLYSELARTAPRVRCLVSNGRGRDLLNELKHGETELALDFQPTDGEGIRYEPLGSAKAIALARIGHPALKNGLTKKLYLSLPHAALVWARSAVSSAIALELARMGIETRIAMAVPTVMALGAVVGSSDLIATNSRFAASALKNYFPLQEHPLPFRMPPLTFYLLWHARYDDDAAHRWLRNTIKRLSVEINDRLE